MCNPSCNYQYCPKTTTRDHSLMTSTCLRTNCTQVSWSATLIGDLSANPQDFWGKSISKRKKKKQASPWNIQLDRTIYAWRGGSGGAGHLPGKAGALHSLRPLLDFVLVAAAVQRHHFAGACPDMMRCWRKKWQERWNNQRKKGFNPVAVQRLLPSSTRPRCRPWFESL